MVLPGSHSDHREEMLSPSEFRHLAPSSSRNGLPLAGLGRQSDRRQVRYYPSCAAAGLGVVDCGILVVPTVRTIDDFSNNRS